MIDSLCNFKEMPSTFIGNSFLIHHPCNQISILGVRSSFLKQISYNVSANIICRYLCYNCNNIFPFNEIKMVRYFLHYVSFNLHSVKYLINIPRALDGL